MYTCDVRVMCQVGGGGIILQYGQVCVCVFVVMVVSCELCCSLHVWYVWEEIDSCTQRLLTPVSFMEVDMVSLHHTGTLHIYLIQPLKYLYDIGNLALLVHNCGEISQGSPSSSQAKYFN